MKAKRSQPQPELVHVQVWPLARISPAPENDDIYKPIALDSPDISPTVTSSAGTAAE